MRAPPLTLLGRYVARPAQPMTIAMSSFGLGLAGAAAPYVGLQLKSLDPLWPFALSGLSLAAVTLGMVAAERPLARRVGSAARVLAVATASPERRVNTVSAGAFLFACAAGALAFQWHAFVASAPLALRFAPASDLPWLLLVFWVGFNLALFPAGWWAKRAGALPAMLLGATVAALSSAAAASSPTLVGAALLHIGIVATTTPNPGSAVNLAGLAALGFIVSAALLWPRRSAA